MASAELGSQLQSELIKRGLNVLAISAVTGQGIDELMRETLNVLQSQESKPPVPILVPAMKSAPDISWDVERKQDTFVVHGKRIERMVAMTNTRNDEALQIGRASCRERV